MKLPLQILLSSPIFLREKWRARWALAVLFAFGVNSAIGAEEVRLEGQQVSTNGAYRFFFDAKAGQTYPVSVSGDLIQWSILTNAIGSGGPLWVQDGDAPQHQARFYHIGVHEVVIVPVADMAYIQAGSFTMGSPASEPGRNSNEGPQTLVAISRGFWMGKHEVIQQDYEAVSQSGTASIAQNPKFPVDFVTWNEATNYCYKLTQKERLARRIPAGYAYRLPTEAEWEYASRAGTTTPFGVGNGTDLSSLQANFDGAFPAGAAPAGPSLDWTTFGGSYPANAWGLHDMHGNVWEWCQDVYGPYPGGNVTDPTGAAAGPNHVLRGGACRSVGNGCRSAKRDNHTVTYRNFGQGFRIVLAVDN